MNTAWFAGAPSSAKAYRRALDEAAVRPRVSATPPPIGELDLDGQLGFEDELSRLIDLPGEELDRGIETGLVRMLSALGADRGALLEYVETDGAFRISHAASGRTDAPGAAAVLSFPGHVRRLLRGEIVAFAGERDGLRSSVTLPRSARSSTRRESSRTRRPGPAEPPTSSTSSSGCRRSCATGARTFPRSNAMKCPDCDVEMTRHAKKVIYPRSEDEASLVDEALGGVLLERHTCPGCGKGASQVQEPK